MSDDDDSNTKITRGGRSLKEPAAEGTEVAENEAPAIRKLAFWKDGFSLDGGPLMLYDNSENAKILADLQSGKAPPEFLNVRVGQSVELRVANRTREAYVAVEPSLALATEVELDPGFTKEAGNITQKEDIVGIAVAGLRRRGRQGYASETE
ncbi:hypothetical protein DXG01_005624 [Tephrocybe rancida]|nr:hypothetical protein DXG01_005624 [Tephrocybe rancida]